MQDNSKVWSTPQPLFDKLNAEFHFELDVCALPENAKCARFFTPEDDGLQQIWRGIVWMNPPYGRGLIEPWLKKAFESSSHEGTVVVCLIPGNVNAPWWHRYVLQASEIRFVRKKVPFMKHNEGVFEILGVPFFGSTIAVFRWDSFGHPKVSSYDQPVTR